MTCLMCGNLKRHDAAELTYKTDSETSDNELTVARKKDVGRERWGV